MNGLRKGLVFILVPLLLFALIGAAVSTSSNINLKNPDKIQGWLKDSKLYDHFVSNATEQAAKSTGNNGDSSGSVSLNDEAVKKAAEAAFSSEQIEQYVNTFIDSNYAWLQGKTDKPEYKIDLAKAKLTFAQKVGQYATTYTAGLPVCPADQQAKAEASDPLTATCRPSNVTPEQVGTRVTQEISTGDFLRNPVITADTINPDNNASAQPYYKKLSRLPQLYSLGVNLPYIFTGVSLTSVLGLIFLSATRRGGFKKTAWIFAIAGAILVTAKFSSDIAFNQLEQRAFNNSSIGQLQQSLTTFAHSIQSAFTQTEMLFGIAYLLLALIIMIVLLATRNRQQKADEATDEKPSQISNDQPATSRITTQPKLDSAKYPSSQATTAPPLPTKPTPKPTTQRKKPKRPRLIQ